MSKVETSFLTKFVEEKKGNVAITFGMMALVMTGALGAAVDIGRALHAQSKLQTAADTATTAAAGAVGVTEAQRIEIAKNFFANNNGGSFGDNPDVRVDVTANGNNVKISIEGSVATSITKVLGVDNIPISAKSEAGTSGRQLELSMMIDLTGSMSVTRGSMKKIDALKLAADDLLDILFPNGETTSGQVKVAVAPMADYVNAGPYAAAVTGLPQNGPYANLTNLKSTKNGPFSGNHSGSYGSTPPLGSQHGTTPINNAVVSGQVSGAVAGQTYSSAHCTAAGSAGGTGPVAQLPRPGSAGGYPLGYYLHDGVSDGSLATPPPQLNKGPGRSGGQHYYFFNEYDNYGDSTGWKYSNNWSYWANDYDLQRSGYYIPVPADPSLVTYMEDGGSIIGVAFTVDDWTAAVPVQVKKASDYPGGFKPITGFSGGNFTYGANVTTGYFLPVPVSMTGGGGTDPACTGTVASPDQPSGQLISCVTERVGTDTYTDAAPGAGSYIGPYNQVAPGRSTNKLNYSQDGKCYTAGRELPAIIPLTNNRTTLDSFFSSATVGGATPGHLGHAWAWYMLSPAWNSVWPTNAAAPYNDQIVKKYAVIMTDGEYNTQYSSATSRAQAKELCDGMKAKNIHVITVGFGFMADAEGTTAGQMLSECASDSESFFWPYDADQLRQTFKDIGAKLTGETTNLVVMK